MRIITLSLLSLFLVSCATTRKFENVLDTWVGKSTQELIAHWGRPKRVTNGEYGSTLYEYWFLDKESKEKAARNLSSGIEPSCKTSFLVDQSMTIVSWKWEGYNCRVK